MRCRYLRLPWYVAQWTRSVARNWQLHAGVKSLLQSTNAYNTESTRASARVRSASGERYDPRYIQMTEICLRYSKYIPKGNEMESQWLYSPTIQSCRPSMHEVESYIGTLMAPSLRQVLLSCLLSNSVADYPVHQVQLLHSGPRTSSTRPTRGPPPHCLHD